MLNINDSLLGLNPSLHNITTLASSHQGKETWFVNMNNKFLKILTRKNTQTPH